MKDYEGIVRSIKAVCVEDLVQALEYLSRRM